MSILSCENSTNISACSGSVSGSRSTERSKARADRCRRVGRKQQVCWNEGGGGDYRLVSDRHSFGDLVWNILCDHFEKGVKGLLTKGGCGNPSHTEERKEEEEETLKWRRSEGEASRRLTVFRPHPSTWQQVLWFVVVAVGDSPKTDDMKSNSEPAGESFSPLSDSWYRATQRFICLYDLIMAVLTFILPLSANIVELHESTVLFIERSAKTWLHPMQQKPKTSELLVRRLS